MIDVKELIAKYSLQELNETADEYYKSINLNDLSIKPFRLPEIKHLLVELSYLIYLLDVRPGDRVLDFGCGTGWTSRILYACGCDVVALDVSETALAAARSISKQWQSAGLCSPYGGGAKLDFRRFDGITINVEDCSVDKIFVLDAFHHVPNQASVIREFARVIKPGGTAGFCEPGPHHSKEPESQREMMLHKVIENDIVLSEIYSIAKNEGFEELKVCLSPLLPMVVDFEDYSAFPSNASVAGSFVQATDWRVKNYPVFLLKKQGTASLDSRSILELRSELKLTSPTLMVCDSGKPIEIRFRATNTGSAVWLPSGPAPGSVNIGIIVTAEHEPCTHHRSHLSNELVAPGMHVDALAFLPALKKGSYDIEVDLVSEHVAWFKNLGNSELQVKARIT